MPTIRNLLARHRGAFLVGVLLLGVTGCGTSPASDESSPKGAPALKVARPHRQTMPRLIEQPARIEPFEETAVSAKIAGYLKEVRVQIGTPVKCGELLAELSVPELHEELKAKVGLIKQAEIDITLAERTQGVAQAQCRTAAAQATEARASRKRAEAHLARWKSEAARMESLARGKVIDPLSKDEAVNQWRESEAALEEAVARIDSTASAQKESQARLEKARADVEAAQNRLALARIEQQRVAALVAYTRLTAPFDGVVSQRFVHSGHFLQPGSKPEPLFVVVRTDKVRIFLEVPEADAGLVRCGEQEGCVARIRVPALNDREFTGRVSGTSWSLDPAQRTLRTEIDFDNPHHLLRPGMYAHATLETEHTDAWTLPSSALLTRDGQTFCFLLQEGKAVRTAVKVGDREGGIVEVLKWQRRPMTPRQKPRWVDFTGSEEVLIGDISDLADGQVVKLSAELLAAR